LKPFVRREYLLLISGGIWIAIGILLDRYAYLWLSEGHFARTWAYVAGGAALALVIHHFGFLRVVDRNLGRIGKLGEQTCAFAFMSWKSYLLVAVMVGMGIALRRSGLPRSILSVLYIGIGSALILSSVRYMRVFLGERRGRKGG